jgi:hypothetical protein
MANPALMAALSDLPPDLTTGARTQDAYGGFNRAVSGNLHQSRMQMLEAERRALVEAEWKVKNQRVRQTASNILGAAVTAGTLGAGAPAGLAMMGGQAAGSLFGQTPSRLSTVGPLGFSEAGRNYLSGQAVRRAVDEDPWGSLPDAGGW